MPENERRLSPRRAFVVPLRFRVSTSVSQGTQKGETMNLSDHGILFTCDQNFIVGAQLELSFSSPDGLARNDAPEVRCKGRVVHVQRGIIRRGSSAVGVLIEQWEPASAPLKWAS